PIGTFFVGRQCQIEGVWGTSFLDTEEEADSIKYVKKIDNLTLSAIFQKDVEQDEEWTDLNLNGTVDPGETVADEDSDTYYLLGKYKTENVTPGLLLAFTNDKTNPSATTRVYTAIPYFVSKFGPLAIQGELAYKWGETEFDSGTADRDIKKLAYNLEATYNLGPASVMAGYAFVSGDDDATDDENSAYGTVGEDWEKLFILTYDEAPVDNLGNMGNLVDTGNYGAKIIYGGATFSPLDNLELGVVAGTAIADEVQFANQEDDIGAEYDLTLNWQIYDNLTYTAIAAFLDAGDIWKGKGGAATEIEDTFALFHQLELSF
ncbi:MAG: hypothetical protein U9R02_01860, partial [Thermodesulfobacteriota bacterium]|nr:hypothetical protein [Thermodesulfobacteriota bacterium]